MDVVFSLFTPGNESLAATLVLYSFVIAAGIYLGKMKIGGISLGVTFVLFVGILMGHFGYVVNAEVLKFVREFGLILFIFAIGLQVGPSFFASFKEGGVKMNILAVLTVLLDVVIVVALFYIDNCNTSITALVGIMSGAVTNTPGLAAAQQSITALGTPQEADVMAMGYAAAYPLGVVGIITSMLVLKWIFRINIDQEKQKLEDDTAAQNSAPLKQSYEITNELVNGLTLLELHKVIHCDYVISRLLNAYNEVIIPTSQTKLHVGDKVMVIMSPQDEQAFSTVLGRQIEMEWEETQSQVISRRIVITQPKYDGVSLGSLRLHTAYQLNATRVNRSGVELLASPGLRLQMGDRITVVGTPNDIERLATRLGNSMKRLNEPNLITIFVGILLGIVVGSINVGYGMKLGLAGGPLVVAILLSKFGYRAKLITYTSTSASMLMRELGICLFLASVGIAAGKGFAATVFNPTGAIWVLWGFLITVIPLLIVGFIARKVFKFNYLHIMGMMSGSYTDPPALAYAGSSTGSDAPAVAYSTVYPLTMFLRVVAAQVLVLALFS